MGACGAGAAGSESQPYLEGGIEAVALPGGGAGTPGRGTRPTRGRCESERRGSIHLAMIGNFQRLEK